MNSSIKNPVFIERMKSLESVLSHIAGIPVEITIRALRNFTFTFDGKNDEAMDKLQGFFNGKLNGIGYDEECNMSYAYLDV